MKVGECITKFSVVMIYDLIMVDSAGIPVMDDNIDYIHSNWREASSKADAYDEWYVEDVAIHTPYHVTLTICQIDREEAGL